MRILRLVPLFLLLVCACAQTPKKEKAPTVVPPDLQKRFFKATGEVAQAQLNVKQAEAAVPIAQQVLPPIIAEIQKFCGPDADPRQADAEQAKALSTSAQLVGIGDVICIAKVPPAKKD